MLNAVIHTPPLTELLSILGPGGTVVGGMIGLTVASPTLRRAFENLTLGATVGGVFGCLVAFLFYDAARIVGG